MKKQTKVDIKVTVCISPKASMTTHTIVAPPSIALINIVMTGAFGTSARNRNKANMHTVTFGGATIVWVVMEALGEILKWWRK
jgi:hypothetical protein